ncbi:hypothetical protein DI270_024630 [Microbispora triticiradicis]|uniref:Uncharacterized protein n=1 Tax=Microbispora triticiradicis TaxID=2200763 RepID=A0ABX9LGY4_9ACTN|nr:hypothetical protein DI270_024630 [Microbispora triticiradicis]
MSATRTAATITARRTGTTNGGGAGDRDTGPCDTGPCGIGNCAVETRGAGAWASATKPSRHRRPTTERSATARWRARAT